MIDSVVGRGSTGEVWRGRTRETGEAIAAKVLDQGLTREPEVVARFIRERALLTRVTHPNVVTVRDLVVEGDTLAIITDLVDGPSLRAVLDRHGTLRPVYAVDLCEQILLGLSAVHEQGLVHRDLKPENVLVAQSEAGDAVARIVDFGIAQLAHGDSANERGEIVGSAEYIAPELLEGGTATAASDLYAVGILLYELVCGRTPFASEGVATVIRRQLSEPPGRPAGMPLELWGTLQQLLAKEPQRRPASALDAVDMLSAVRPSVRTLDALPVAVEDDPVVLDGDDTIITPRRKGAHQTDSEPVQPSRPHRRRRRAVAALIAVAAIVAGTFVFTRGDPAAATTLQSVPETWDSGKTVVDRTLTLDGDTLDVHVTAKHLPDQDFSLAELIPEPFRGQQIAVAGHQPGKPDPSGVLWIRIPAQRSTTAERDYQIKLPEADRTPGFVRAYERQRVAMMATAPEAARPDAIIQLDVPRQLRLRPFQRAWLPVGGITTDGGASPTVVKDLGGTVQWKSSDAGIASVIPPKQPLTDADGRSADTEYFRVDAGGRHGTATLSATLGGQEYAIRVTVSGPSVNDGHVCDPGVSPATRLELSEAGGRLHPVEGTLLEVDSTGTYRANGLDLVTETSKPCEGASVVPLSRGEYTLLVRPREEGVIEEAGLPLPDRRPLSHAARNT